jgi:hypothetical protein
MSKDLFRIIYCLFFDILFLAVSVITIWQGAGIYCLIPFGLLAMVIYYTVKSIIYYRKQKSKMNKN